jgi:hypothetical protein
LFSGIYLFGQRLLCFDFYFSKLNTEAQRGLSGPQACFRLIGYDQAATGHCALCLGQLRYIDSDHLDIVILQLLTCLWERSGINDRITDGQAIRRIWFRRVHFNQLKTHEMGIIHPILVDQ